MKVRYLWSILLPRVYELMPLKCPQCGGEMKIIAFIKDQGSINEILSHMTLPIDALVLSSARGPPIEYDQVDRDIEETFDELPEDDIDQSVSW